MGASTMEIPKDISGKMTALMVTGAVLILFFGYRAHVNSRQALRILDVQVPNITRVAFDTQVFALTPANLEPILTTVAGQYAGSEDKAGMDKFKKEFASHLWIV